MNIITHDKAYCLFPRATLDERRAMSHLSPVDWNDRSQSLVYDKYTARGYDLLHIMPDDLKPGGSFADGRRSVGDKKSWVLPILPVRPDLVPSTVHANSFGFQSSRRLRPFIDYSHLYLADLCHKYVVALPVVSRLFCCTRYVKPNDPILIWYVALRLQH